MIEAAKDTITGLSWSAITLVLISIYYIARHGLPWFIGKVKSISSSAAEDYVKLRDRFHADAKLVEARFSTLESEVAALKTQLQNIAPSAPRPLS